MGGEVTLGKVKRVHITKVDNKYDMSFNLEDGTFHIVSIEDLPYLLIKALGNIEDWNQKMEKTETLLF